MKYTKDWDIISNQIENEKEALEFVTWSIREYYEPDDFTKQDIQKIVDYLTKDYLNTDGFELINVFETFVKDQLTIVDC